MTLCSKEVDMSRGVFSKLHGSKKIIWITYSALALLILLPLLLPGYILTLDLVFTPNISWPDELSNTYPLEILLWLMGLIIPGDVVQKTILFAILLLSGIGMHFLIVSISPRGAHNAWRLASYVAGIFYMINPFIYARFMAGQWMFLLGYALLPFFVRSLVYLSNEPSLRNGIRTGLWAVLIVSVSIHHIGMLVIIGMALTVAAVIRFRRAPNMLKRLIISSSVSIGIFIAISSFWLIPAVLGSSEISHSTAGFDKAHFEAFSTDGGGIIGKSANVIRLQGFWVESQQIFTLPQAITPGWGLFFLAVWAVVITGGISAWKHHRTIVGFATVCIIAGTLLSATPIIAWASTYLPFVAGYREPHKFAGLVALGFAILLAYGTAHILAAKRTKSAVLALGLLLLPFIITPTMAWGFANQLSPRHYPAEWYETNEILNQTAANDTHVLFLPWHQYAPYSFSGRLIANPAEKFFEVSIIASNDPEFDNISPTSPDPVRQRIKALLTDRLPNVAKELSTIGISHIVLANEQDVKEYQWLGRQPGVRKIHENNKLTIYSVEEKK